MLHPSNLSGETLGNYKLYESIGAGGMAVVYRAEQLVVHRTVAMKVLSAMLADDDEFVTRFRREAETAARLEHPHIVPVYDFGAQKDILYVVMRFLPGGSLAQRLKRLGIPTLADTGDLLTQIGAALDYAHKNGVIHRDIKPANILLDEEGRAYLADFGIARLMNTAASVVTTGIGTPAYMAPEQFVGQSIDTRTDIYSLGVMLYVLTVGKLPFEADSQMGMAFQHINTPPVPPIEAKPELPVAVSDVILKALAKAPGERYATASTLAAAFNEALTTAQNEQTIRTPYFVRPLPASAPIQVDDRGFPQHDTPPSRPSGQRPPTPPPIPSPVQQSVGLVSAPASSQPRWQLPEANSPLLDTQPSRPGGVKRSIPLLAGLLALLCLGGTALVLAVAIPRLTNLRGTPTAVAVGGTSTSDPDVTPVQPVTATTTGRTVSSTNTPSPTTLPTATVPTDAPDTPTPVPPPAATPVPGLIRSDARNVPQVWVPAGCFMMGSDPTQDPSAQQDEMPQHQVCISQGYWLDQFEVTNAAYQQFIDNGGYSNKDWWSDDGWQWLQTQKISGPLTFMGTTGLQQPRVGVSWYEADAYAHWRGGRLPTEAEWEFAARGPESRIYPWGNTYQSGYANVDESAAGGANNKQSVAVGGYTAGKSWVNAYDMAGNVWEWTDDWYDANYYLQRIRNDPSGPVTGTTKSLRGGSWFNDPACTRAACRRVKFRGRTPDSRDDAVGFRIVVLPESAGPTPTYVPATPTLGAVYGQCPGYMPSRLSVGRYGRVVPGGTANRLREEPGGRVIGQIPAEGVFRVISGPRCASDGIAWWQVEYNKQVGWTAEGQNGVYWLEFYIQPSPTPG